MSYSFNGSLWGEYHAMFRNCATTKRQSLVRISPCPLAISLVFSLVWRLIKNFQNKHSPSSWYSSHRAWSYSLWSKALQMHHYYMIPNFLGLAYTCVYLWGRRQGPWKWPYRNWQGWRGRSRHCRWEWQRRNYLTTMGTWTVQNRMETTSLP